MEEKNEESRNKKSIALFCSKGTKKWILEEKKESEINEKGRKYHHKIHKRKNRRET